MSTAYPRPSPSTTTTSVTTTSTPIPTSLAMQIPHPFPWAVERQRECYSLVAKNWIEAGRITLTDVLMISEMFRGFMRYSAIGLTVGFLTSLSVIPALRAIRPRFSSRVLGYLRLPVRTGMTLTGGVYGAYYGLGLPFQRYGRPFTGEEVKRRVPSFPSRLRYVTSLLPPITNLLILVCLLCTEFYVYILNGI
ncbi:hypothetical protein HD553DRAFT_317712 [Filobasidium floriforme]|uniref:uncharacterized protein n=1 Tax=Filobasidium floriforme TaxID=5210 RepID=UPI001E8DC64B|nr:uncharacterized protein HD553DRAFT_317712 [Filobasidium floriforme]KAH8080225.1 hypothetical protein HD553DRAFT_317712 [Filobasidium floriforme]